MSSQTTSVRYDGFGRLISLQRPSADGTALAPPVDGTTPPLLTPSVKIDYSLPSAQAPRAYSVIHTQTQDGATESSGDYLESYSYVDGMGRARVGLAEADPGEDAGNHWIVSSIAQFDAKGAVRRKYLPSFLTPDVVTPDPSHFPVADSPPGTQYGRQRY